MITRACSALARHSDCGLGDVSAGRGLSTEAAGEFFCQAVHLGSILIFVCAGPLAREVCESYRPVQLAHDLLHIILHLSRAFRHGFGNARGRIHQNVLKMSEHAGRGIFKTFTWFPGNRGADTGKIVVSRYHTGGKTVWPAEREVVGLNQHLEKGVVPPYADALLRWPRDALTDLLIKRCYIGKAPLNFSRWLVMGITIGDELHERGWRDALGYHIVRTCNDRREPGRVSVPPRQRKRK